MPAHRSYYHSEYDHARLYGSPDYCRTLRAQDHPFNCAIRCEMEGEPWTYVACSKKGNTQGQCHICGGAAHVAHRDAIVIAVDGACRNNGYYNADSSVGIFFHRGSDFNHAATVHDTSGDPTSQRAELVAAREALRMAKNIRNENPRAGTPRFALPPPGPRRKLRRVVIMADSKYMVDAMTGWIFKWRSNGYLNSKSQGVVNAELFREIEQAVVDLNDLNVDVQFWHVRRRDNPIADSLANAALDGLDAEEALERYFG